MSFISPGQMGNELAKQLFLQAKSQATLLVKAGKITPTDHQIAFAKLVAESFGGAGLKVPKKLLPDLMKQLPFVDKMLVKTTAKTIQAVSGSAVKSAAVSAGSVAVKHGMAEAAKASTRGAGPFAAGIFAIEGGYNGYRLWRGHITRAEFKRRTARSAAANAGGVAGAAAGAAIGSVVPIVGTAIGSVIGGVIGGIGSGLAADRVLKK